MAEAHGGSVAIVNAYKAYTGSSSVARSYYDGLRQQNFDTRWYQCVSSREESSYDRIGLPINGYAPFRDDLNLVLNSLFVFPRKIGRLKERIVVLTDPILLCAAPYLSNAVVIVHDLREFLAYRRSLAAGTYFRWLFHHLGLVQHIVCDSESTRTELLRFYRPDIPVDVIHPCSRVVGRPIEHTERSLQRATAERNLRLLYIAADRPYKNIPFFGKLAKMLESPRRGWSFRFRLVSRIGPATAREMERLGATNLEVISEVDDLTSEYQWADVLVHPSLVEGFGLPPVEAMQWGIPIIASDVPCLREIIGPGGSLLDPSDTTRWASAVEELTDPGVYLERARSSAARGNQFTQQAFESRLRGWVQARQL